VKRFLFSVAASFLFLQPLFAIDLPNPPAGFSWQQIPELKAAFLKPDGWFFTSEKQKGTLAYFITKEKFDQNGQFETGLTVNVFRELTGSAVSQGQATIANIASEKHGETWTQTVGPFQEFGCSAKDSEAVMRYLAIANPKTNTLYLFIFESPVSDWGAVWKIGKQIMDSLAIDDGI
jgi:hypothetical protein